MEAIKTLTIKERPLDLSVLYHRIKELEERITQWSQSGHTLKVKTSEGLDIIPFEDLIRCQSDGNYTHLYLKEGRKICVSKTLKYIQGLLPQKEFLRIHASHLVSIAEVRRILNSHGRTVVLSNGDSLPVSRTYHQDVEVVFS